MGHKLKVREGVYPQSNGGLAFVDIDASKGSIALWVHLFVCDRGDSSKWVTTEKVFFLVSTKFKHV